MSAEKYVTLIEYDSVALLTIRRPPVNALSIEVLTELEETVHSINANDAIKSVVLAGGSKTFFCAGADIKELSTIQSEKDGLKYAEYGQSVLNKIDSAPKPYIAAVEGVCVGGGLELALACHLRIAGAEATFAMPEVNLGIMPGFGGTCRLPERIGKSRALEMMLTGKEVTAEQAQGIGLINQIVKSGAALETALHLARQITDKGGRAIAAIMSVVNNPDCASQEERLQKEAEAFGKLLTTRDAQEGLLAFLEKRLPHFKDH
ncbi:MAG: enoyl-CoA hydratase/isomerase family protein [Nitrospinae bacterium]|nr:enoyl-CoA hydratase/isomerase family protein [Nitrospinota bacterium]